MKKHPQDLNSSLSLNGLLPNSGKMECSTPAHTMYADKQQKPAQCRTLDGNQTSARPAPRAPFLGNLPDASVLAPFLNNTANSPGAANLPPPGDTIQRAVNRTGLPDQLKTGVENLSGYSMDDVRVHYNSSKPAQLQALAYTQGSDIHVAPGQEKHLPHEAWHVVQQKQGRVQPTMQMKGVNVNDDDGLEKEADIMGDKSNKINNFYKKIFKNTKLSSCDILQKRVPNPHSTNDNRKIGGWDQTAHHIIPLNLIEKLYNKLTFIHKTEINSIMTYSYQWPKGNLFYGPNTSTRAEPGKKEDFDYDAIYFINPILYNKLLQYYNKFITYENIQNPLPDDKEVDLFNNFKEFYLYTKDQDLCLYDENKWIEINKEEDLKKSQKTREHIIDYSFFKITQMNDTQTTHPDFPEIKKMGGDYYFNKNKIIGQFKGTFFYIQRNKSKELDTYLLNNSVKNSTFLPKEFFAEINIAEKLSNEDFKKSITIKFNNISEKTKTYINSLQKNSSKIEKTIPTKLKERYDLLRNYNKKGTIEIPEEYYSYLKVEEKQKIIPAITLVENNKQLIENQINILTQLENISTVEINRGNSIENLNKEQKKALEIKLNEIKKSINETLTEIKNINKKNDEIKKFLFNRLRVYS